MARTFERPITGGQKGIYRIVLAATPDIYVTVRLPSALKIGYSGHPTFMHGHGDMMRKSYLFVPPGTSGLFFAFAEPDMPRTRNFKLSDAKGKVFFDGPATGGYTSVDGPWQQAKVPFGKAGDYDNQLFTFEVSPGANDFLAKVTFQQPNTAFKDYVGMGSSAVFCDDPETAMALRGGTTVVDGLTFWHPFQIRFHEWLKANGEKLDEATRKDLDYIFKAMRLLETSDGRGSASWTNWAYAMGYYGCDIFRPSWVLLKRKDIPDDLRAIIKEGLIMGGDRLSFATHIEKVNGNAFSQIPVALWYCQSATGDALLKERFEVYWQRWTTQGWGQGSGLSPSGDSQEHFGHDMLYGSYIMNNWKPTGNTWVKGGGILGDATDDPRFQKIMDRYFELYSYLLCREAGTAKARGALIAANPWSSRTNGGPSQSTLPLWDNETHPWKGVPGPDLTVDVNDGHEWFAARRAGYYMLTFHGRLAPAWMSETFQGQLGFGGGIICQLTIPGKGPVLASTLNDQYGRGMHPSEWPTFHLHSLVGERWDGFHVISGISEHADARLVGNTVTSSGEIRGAHLKVTRSYTYEPDGITCTVQLAKSDFGKTVYLWGHEANWSELRLAREMIPYLPKGPDRKTPTAVLADDDAPLTAEPIPSAFVKIDRGGFGVVIQFDQPQTVSLGENNTVLIHLVDLAPKPTPAERVGLKYRLVPFGADPVAPPPAVTPTPAPQVTP